MTLDPQKKFQLVNEIIQHLETNYMHEDYNGNLQYKEERVRILLRRSGIIYT